MSAQSTKLTSSALGQICAYHPQLYRTFSANGGSSNYSANFLRVDMYTGTSLSAQATSLISVNHNKQTGIDYSKPFEWYANVSCDLFRLDVNTNAYLRCYASATMGVEATPWDLASTGFEVRFGGNGTSSGVTVGLNCYAGSSLTSGPVVTLPENLVLAVSWIPIKIINTGVALSAYYFNSLTSTWVLIGTQTTLSAAGAATGKLIWSMQNSGSGTNPGVYGYAYHAKFIDKSL